MLKCTSVPDDNPILMCKCLIVSLQCMVRLSGDEPIPRFVLLQMGLQSNQIAAFYASGYIVAHFAALV